MTLLALTMTVLPPKSEIAIPLLLDPVAIAGRFAAEAEEEVADGGAV